MAQPDWDLTVLYRGFDDPFWRADCAAAKVAAREALSCIKDLSPGDFDAALALQKIEASLLLHARTATYARMVQMADGARADALDALATLDQAGADNAAAVSVFARLVQKSGRADALAAEPALLNYAAFFRLQAEAARHALPEAVEPIVLRMQQTGGQGWSRLRDAMESGMTAAVTLGGATKTLPIAQVRALFSDADADVRKNCLAADMDAGCRAGTVYAACLNGIKGEALEMAQLRGYDSVLDWMLSLSRMEKKTLDALQAAILGALPAFQRFLKAKARLLGHETALPYCDISAPVGHTARFTLSEARRFLVDAFYGADPALAAFTDAAFENNWIDAIPRAGKQSGGICFPLHAAHESRILVNFDGGFSGVASLAHELGHAWHDRQMFSLPLILRDAPTPVCETASAFNETLVYEYARAKATGSARLSHLNAVLSGAVQTILDTHSRFLFEDEVFRRRADGPLTADALASIMENCQRAVYGDALSALHPYMWIDKVHAYIPDFHYYNFPYAFGLLFARGLYRAYKQAPGVFFARYNRLLAQACTCSVEEAGLNMGLDLTDEAFWRGALSDFIDLAEEFERLSFEEE